MSSDEEEEVCPLCCEVLDVTDQNFFPCPCGYQVCLYCWNHIKCNLNGLCPACRTPYRDDPQVSPVDREEIIRKKKEKKKREKEERKAREARQLLAGSTEQRKVSTVIDRAALRNVRVVQRNLAYVVGVPSSIASEDILRRPEYFGQYGKIVKIAVNRNPPDGKAPGCSVYVTFAHKEDARACIQALDTFTLDGRQIRASFGTTKYCNTFLRYLPCHSADCLFLHEVGPEEDSLTKEEFAAWQLKGVPGSLGSGGQVLVGHGGPSGTGKRCANPVFPPPRFELMPAPAPTRAAKPTVAAVTGTANPWQPPPPAPAPPIVNTTHFPSPNVGASPPPGPLTPQRPPIAAAAGGGAASTPTDAGVPTPTTQHGHAPAVAPTPTPQPQQGRAVRAATPTGVPIPTQAATPVANGPKAPVTAGKKPQIATATGAPASTVFDRGSPLGPTPMQAAQMLAAKAEASKGVAKGGKQGGKHQKKAQSQVQEAATLRESAAPAHAEPPTQPSSQAPAPPQPAPDAVKAPPPPGVVPDLLEPLSAPLPPPSLVCGSGPLQEPRSLLGGGDSSASVFSAGLGRSSGASAASAEPSWSTPPIDPATASQPLSLFGLPPSTSTATVGGDVGPMGSTGEGTSGTPSRANAPPPPGIGLLGSSTTTPGSSNPHVLLGTGGLFPDIWGTQSGASSPSTFAPWERVEGASGATPSPSTSAAVTPGTSSSSVNGVFQKAPGPGPSQNGFHHSLFPFQITPAPHEDQGGGGSAGGGAGEGPHGADPFTSTESLARILGLSLPDHADSLSAQAARGLPKSTSRFSFAHDDGDDGANKVPQAAHRQQAGGTAVQPHAGFQGGGLLGLARQAPPSVQSVHAQTQPPRQHQQQPQFQVGLLGANDSTAGGRKGSAQAQQPAKQSGISMLQQLLPNVQVTYGQELPEDMQWARNSPASSGGLWLA